MLIYYLQTSFQIKFNVEFSVYIPRNVDPHLYPQAELFNWSSRIPSKEYTTIELLLNYARIYSSVLCIVWVSLKDWVWNACIIARKNYHSLSSLRPKFFIHSHLYMFVNIVCAASNILVGHFLSWSIDRLLNLFKSKIPGRLQRCTCHYDGENWSYANKNSLSSHLMPYFITFQLNS